MKHLKHSFFQFSLLLLHAHTDTTIKKGSQQSGLLDTALKDKVLLVSHKSERIKTQSKKSCRSTYTLLFTILSTNSFGDETLM